MFKFIRNFWNVFQCSSSVSHSYQQCHWPLVLSASFILVILVAVKWCLILVLICIFQTVNDAEVFPCAYWSFIYLKKDSIFKRFSHFKIWHLLFIVELQEFFIYIIYIFWKQIPNQSYNLKMFFLILWVGISLSYWCSLKHKHLKF